MTGEAEQSGTRIRLVNQAGRVVRRITKKDPLTLEVVVPGKVDRDAPPESIEVEFKGEGDWTSDDMTIAWNGDHRGDTTVFRSETLTMAGGGEGGGRVSVGGFTWKTGGLSGMNLDDGQQVTIKGPDGTVTTVEVFASGATLAHAELTDAATNQRNHAKTGAANVQKALDDLAALEGDPDIDPEKAKALKAKLEERLRQLKKLLCLAEHALAYLANEKYAVHKQNAAARYYLEGARGTGADPDAIDHAGLATRLDNVKWEMWEGPILDSLTMLTKDAYRGIMDSTGVGPLWTLLSGTDIEGKPASWDKRLVAFCDLVSMAAMTGAQLRSQMKSLNERPRPSGTTRTSAGNRPKYKGDSPDKAPTGTTIDPADLGYSPEGIRGAHQVARKHDVVIQSRPTNPYSKYWKSETGAMPKPEKYKAKTINPVDQMIGADPTRPPGRVGLFDPDPSIFTDKLKKSGMSDAQIRQHLDKIEEAAASGGKVDIPVPPKPPGAGMSDDLWKSTVKRWGQRKAEWNGPTGQKMRDKVAKGELEIEPGGAVKENGRYITGDYDTFEILDRNGNPVPKELYDKVIADLQANGFEAQHGSHMRWNPQRADYPDGPLGDAKFKEERGIYEKIVQDHANRMEKGTQKGEILINLGPEGPPVATYSGEKPGQYLGDLTTKTGEIVPGSGMFAPAQWTWFGLGALNSDPLDIRFDDDLLDLGRISSEIGVELEPCHSCIETPMVVLPLVTKSPSLVTKVAVGVGALLLTGGGLFVATQGDDGTAAIPAAEAITDDSPIESGDDVITDDPPADDGPDEQIAVPAPDATGVVFIDDCADVTHQTPPDYPDSFTWFDYWLLVAGLDGTIPEGTIILFDFAGADASQLPATVGPLGVVHVQVPISSYADYPPSFGGDLPLSGFDGQPVNVTAAEGPIGGCTPFGDMPDADIAAILASRGYGPDGPLNQPVLADTPDDAIPPPEDELAPLREFLGAWDRAHQAGDAQFLFDTLDQRVLDRYGATQCREYLDGVVGSVIEIELLDGQRVDYDYPTDGLTTDVFEAWRVDIEALVLDTDREPMQFHLLETDDGVRWFSDCGTPAP